MDGKEWSALSQAQRGDLDAARREAEARRAELEVALTNTFEINLNFTVQF